MSLPEPFQFSQTRLQDYVDCPRRFQLRHVLMQPWPALITESPIEEEHHRQRGVDLHRLAHQHTLGLDPDRLAASIHDDTVFQWWQTYLDEPPPGLLESPRRAEAIVAATLAGHRIMAKYDLLAVAPDSNQPGPARAEHTGHRDSSDRAEFRILPGEKLVIVDWKAVLKRPHRETLARRMQTRVYRFLAVKAGAEFCTAQTLDGSQRLDPSQVEMVYWFANESGATEHFPYSQAQFDDDRQYISGLIRQIVSIEAPIWPLTANERRCKLCNYRSLCDRGVKAGFLEDMEDDLELDDLEIDLEQVAEIAF